MCFVVAIVWSLVLVAGCTASWTSEATNIIALLGPAIAAALGIVSAFGKGISEEVLVRIQAWEQQATTDLATVNSLVQQYNDADPATKQTLLTQIQEVLKVGIDNLDTILPELHITNADTQKKVMAIYQAIVNEWAALVALIPTLQKVAASDASPHAQLRTLAASPEFQDVKSADDFKKEFNGLTKEFGKLYQI